MKRRSVILACLFCVAGITASAEQPPRRGGGPGQGPGPGGAPPGKWWDRPEIVEKLKLSADQQKKLDDVFQQSRNRLIDLHAALDKEEAALDPLMQAAQLDDSKVLPQIDRIAAARSELEKAEARLMLGERHVLTLDQWRTLETFRPTPPPRDGPPRRQED